MRKACVTALLSLVLAAGASAATPIYWPAKKMSDALVALRYPHTGTFAGVCSGVGKARHAGYTGFKCRMSWQIDGTGGASTSSGTVTAYARPLTHGRVCASMRSLASCQPLKAGPLAGDPTVCTVNDKTACAQAAAKAAVTAKHGAGVANLACTETVDLYHWACTSLSGPFTVTFTRGTSAWVATVTP